MKLVFIEESKFGSYKSGNKYWINAEHITYVVERAPYDPRTQPKGCSLRIMGRETLLETDESFENVMLKIRSA